MPASKSTPTKTPQRDLLTGEWHAKPPKRGSGVHIRLTRSGAERIAVAGMAAYAGEGPPGKYCRDCYHFGEVAVQTGADSVEVNRAGGCALYAQYMRHAAPTRRRDIGLCSACKHFSNSDSTSSVRRFVIDRTGVVHQVETFPLELRRWRTDG